MNLILWTNLRSFFKVYNDLIIDCNGTEEDLYFDSIVGALQDTVLEEEFVSV